MVIITSRLGVTCADPDALHRAALARAEVEGVSPAAYAAARAQAPASEAFDLETVLSFAVRSAGCGVSELAVTVREAPRSSPPAGDDLIARDRRPDR